MEGDQEKSGLQGENKRFMEWFGHPNDPTSLYRKLWLICKNKLYSYEQSDAEDLMQETVIQLNRERLSGKHYDNFDNYCCVVVSAKIREYRRKKSRSIDYRKYDRDLVNLISESKSNEDINKDFIEKAELLHEYIFERDVIDERLIESLTDELIEIGKQGVPSISEDILKKLEGWHLKIKKKIRENRQRMDSLDNENDEDNEGALRSYDPVPDTSGDVEEVAMDRQFTERLFSCVDALPEKLREPFQLRMGDDLQFEEIVAITGVSMSTISGRVKKAKELLAFCMAKHTKYDVSSDSAKKAIKLLQDKLKNIERI